MSKLHSQARISLHYVFGCLGIALLVYLIVHAGPHALLEHVKLVGWGVPLVIVLGGLSHAVKAWAWRLTLPKEQRYSFSRLFGLRLVSEAIGQLGLPGMVAGEATRVTLLGPDTSLESRILSATLDRVLFIVCGAIVTISGVTLSLLVVSLSNTLRIYAALFTVGFMGILCTAALAVSKRWPVISAPARALQLLPWIGPTVARKLPLVVSVEQKLLQFRRERPYAFGGSVALNFACHALAITEVYLILLFMGKHVAWTGALILESLTKLINAAGVLNPGNVGTYEGGTVLIASLFGLNSMAGLTLGLCRRARAILWALVGGVFFFVISRSRDRRTDAGNDSSSSRTHTASLPETPREAHSETPPNTTAAIIFAEGYNVREFSPELSPIGTLPVILRAILQAQSLDASRIIVASSGLSCGVIRRELSATGRLPKNVEWIELGGSRGRLLRILSEVAAESDRILLVSGCATYHSSLFETIRHWEGQGEAIVLTSRGESAGVAALCRKAALDLAVDCPLYVETALELYSWLKASHSAVFAEVDGNLWQAVAAPSDRLIAERKLDTWLVKATDGLYARMNRRISIPISRQLIKFPITPNMVTLFTLGVSFLAGAFFAFGGYWNSLLGAFFSIWASILDGCDGEVARLKLQASKFGCWLETICDYLYYLFIFAGMSLGLSKTRGTDAYLTWGGVLVFGAVLSFLIIGFARHYFSGRNPEQFLRIWQRKADEKTSNPLMYVARNLEFLTRRCCLPYILLAFAVLNLTRFFFIGTAIGANIVWIMSLYSYCVLSRRQSSLTSGRTTKHPTPVGRTVLT